MNIIKIPLSDICVDYEWNSRSRANVFARESDAVQNDEHVSQGEGLEGLKRTIAERGQDTQVIVIPYDKPQPYFLIAGFRRFTAIQQLGQTDILAEVRHYTELEAVLLNGRENTDRQNLSAPDQVYLVSRLLSLGLTVGEIARELSISSSYTSRLAKIARLPKDIIQHWRGEGSIPGVPRVSRAVHARDLIALQLSAERESLLPHQVVERYTALLAPQPRARVDREEQVHNRVLVAATLAGDLVRAGVLAPGSLEWSRVIGPRSDGYLIDSGALRVHERERYYELAQAAFDAARNK